jgi:general secretion pathway protein I
MKKYNRGFSLLEVLVAFVILGLVLGVLMEIFSSGLRNVGRATESQRAVLLAQSKLASVGIETALREGESNGDFDGGFRWQLSIKPFKESQESQAEFVDPSGVIAPILPVTLLEVEVRVLWGGSEPPRMISLKTLRMANKVKL